MMWGVPCSNYPSSQPPPIGFVDCSYQEPQASFYAAEYGYQSVPQSHDQYQYYNSGYQNQPPLMFIPPAVTQLHHQFAFQPQLAPSAPALHEAPYSSYVSQMSHQMNVQQDTRIQEMQDHMAALALQVHYMEQDATSSAPKEAVQEIPNTTSRQDPDIKAEIKRMFVDEMMRRLAESGTFEITEGTVKEFMKYGPNDPVAEWYKVKRDTNLVDQPWNPEADCEYLRCAMKGLGTNEEKIIHIVTTRNNEQRQKLKLMFKTMYGRDLISDIEKELSGDFRETVMACFIPQEEYDAWSVKQAIYGLGTDEKALIEIFMTRTNAQIEALRLAYPSIVQKSNKTSKMVLEKDIKNDTSGDFKRLLISASQGNRYEITREMLEKSVEEVIVKSQPTGIFKINYNKLVDVNKAQKDALRLFKAGEERWGTDEEEFNLIFSTRNYYHLRVVWDEYVKISQRDILNSISRETSGDFKHGLKAIVTNIRCRPMYFAERLRDAMKGLGTDDKTLIRIIVSRSEVDLIQIKKCFLDITKQTLWRWIKDDTSGDYRRILMALVGKD